MGNDKKEMLEWLNAGCKNPDKREAEIEQTLLDSFLIRKTNGLKGQQASEKANMIYGRTPVYRLDAGGHIISFEPHIDEAGRISWHQTKPTRQYFWQGDVLYGLDGKKKASIYFDADFLEWILVAEHGRKKNLGKDLTKAKQAAIEAVK